MLKEILNSNAYRKGYEKTTMRLLNPGEDVTYEQAAESVEKISAYLTA